MIRAKTYTYCILVMLSVKYYAQESTWTKDDKVFMYQACRYYVDKKYPTPDLSAQFTTDDVLKFNEIKEKSCLCMVDQVQKTMLRSTYEGWLENEQRAFIEQRVNDCVRLFNYPIEALVEKTKVKELESKSDAIKESFFYGMWTCEVSNIVKSTAKLKKKWFEKPMFRSLSQYDVILKEDGSFVAPFLRSSAGIHSMENRLTGTWNFDEETKSLTFTLFENFKTLFFIKSQNTFISKYQIEFAKPNYVKIHSDYTGKIYQLNKQKSNK